MSRPDRYPAPDVLRRLRLALLVRAPADDPRAGSLAAVGGVLGLGPSALSVASWRGRTIPLRDGGGQRVTVEALADAARALTGADLDVGQLLPGGPCPCCGAPAARDAHVPKPERSGVAA